MFSKTRLRLQLSIIGGVFIYFFSANNLSQAQITEDGTLSTKVDSQDNLHYTITGGRQVGSNLFHSFKEFSVPTGGEAVFDFNDTQVNNIFSRVTGNSISNIDGSIKAFGQANLFIINPNGIIFGPNAQLNIGGSFLASTAAQINFADGTFFSATDSQSEPMLTVSIPIGLQFRNQPGNIINRSVAQELGLQVEPKKTVALVGGEITLDGGRIYAPSGRIELGSVTGNSFVSLTPVAQGWALAYDGVQTFQDIQLFQLALANTFDLTEEGSGDILLQGRNIIINNSYLTAINNGANTGGSIKLKASESVEISNVSNVNSLTFSTGTSGNITIETRRLIIDERSFVDTSNQGNGQGGNIIVNASESVEIDGGGGWSSLATASETGGKNANAGNLKITTRRLMLRDGGQISSSTFAGGNGGTVNIDASESIEISGTGTVETGFVLASGILSKTEGQGNGGVLNINTKRLIVRDGGIISVGAIDGATGQAGTVNINASNLLLVSGFGSTLLANSESPKAAGNLFINTGQLNIENGGQVSVSATGEGAAGNLLINAPSIGLNNGILSAETRSGQGNINLQSQNIILRNNSQITTNATGEATGGNITINTNVLTALENSDITANAEDARGGRVTINAQGIFSTQDSDITATSSLGTEFSGIVTLNLPDTDPNRGIVKLSETTVDPNTLIAQNPCQKGTESQFTITRRGSLPPSVNEDLSTSAVEVGLVEPTSTPSTGKQPLTQSNFATSEKPIVPAQGWVFDDKGQILLTAYNPNLTEHERLPPKPQSCPAP